MVLYEQRNIDNDEDPWVLLSIDENGILLHDGLDNINDDNLPLDNNGHMKTRKE